MLSVRYNTTPLRLRGGWEGLRNPVLVLAVFLVLSIPAAVRAQACPADQVQCDGECQAPDDDQGDQCNGSGGQKGTIDACGQCANLQCPGNQILCSGNCQAPAAQCPPNSNRVYNQCSGCGGCATGFTDCNPGGGFDCKATTSASCVSPATWDACSETCTENYVRVNPTAPQSGFISMQGDLRSGGDIYLNNGRAIRIDGVGATEFHLGNWAQGGAGANVFVWGNLNVGGPEFARDLTVFGNIVLPTGGATVDGVDLDQVLTDVAAIEGYGMTLVGSGHTRSIGIAPCLQAGQVRQWNGTGWACATPAPGAITEETDPRFSTWYGNSPEPPAPLTLPSLNVGGGYNPGAGTGITLGANGVLQVGNDIMVGGQIVRENVQELLVRNNAIVLNQGGSAQDAIIRVFGTGNPGARLYWNNTATTDAGRWVSSHNFEAPGFCIGADCRTNWDQVGMTQIAADARYLQLGGGTVTGNLLVAGCLGATFAGPSALPGDGYDGNDANGYGGLAGVCSSGQHVCSTAEILESIKCDILNQKVINWSPANTVLWINNGPPGYTAEANDCSGWTKTNALGAVWKFDTDHPRGVGFLSSCSLQREFACCQ